MKTKKYLGGFGEVINADSTALIPLQSAENAETPAAAILSNMNISDPSDVTMKLAEQYADAGIKKLEMVTAAANLKSLTADRIKTILAALGLWQLFAFLKKNPKKTLIYGGIGFLIIANRDKFLGSSSTASSTAPTNNTTTKA